MKKFNIVLVMILSLLALAGCEKDPGVTVAGVSTINTFEYRISEAYPEFNYERYDDVSHQSVPNELNYDFLKKSEVSFASGLKKTSVLSPYDEEELNNYVKLAMGEDFLEGFEYADGRMEYKFNGEDFKLPVVSSSPLPPAPPVVEPEEENPIQKAGEEFLKKMNEEEWQKEIVSQHIVIDSSSIRYDFKVDAMLYGDLNDMIRTDCSFSCVGPHWSTDLHMNTIENDGKFAITDMKIDGLPVELRILSPGELKSYINVCLDLIGEEAYGIN